MLKGRINLEIANMPYKLLLKGRINLEIANMPYKLLLKGRINLEIAKYPYKLLKNAKYHSVCKIHQNLHTIIRYRSDVFYDGSHEARLCFRAVMKFLFES